MRTRWTLTDVYATAPSISPGFVPSAPAAATAATTAVPVHGYSWLRERAPPRRLRGLIEEGNGEVRRPCSPRRLLSYKK